MRIHKYWSEDDISRLRNMISDGKSTAHIAEALNRTIPSVQSQAYSLGVKIGRPLNQVPWTEDEKKTLVAMRQSGASYATIGKALGRSRTSAIGAGNRMGLSVPVGVSSERVYTPKQATKRPEYVPADGIRVKLARFDMSSVPRLEKYKLKASEPKRLLERKFGECCFPVEGDGSDTLYCCEPAITGKHYCKKHYRVMYVMRT